MTTFFFPARWTDKQLENWFEDHPEYQVKLGAFISTLDVRDVKVGDVGVKIFSADLRDKYDYYFLQK